MKRILGKIFSVLFVIVPWLSLAFFALLWCESTNTGCAIAFACCVLCALSWDALYD